MATEAMQKRLVPTGTGDGGSRGPTDQRLDSRGAVEGIVITGRGLGGADGSGSSCDGSDI